MTSFIGEKTILTTFGGNVLLFDNKGTFLSKVEFKSPYKPLAECFVLRDLRTILVEKVSDCFIYDRYELAWDSEKSVFAYEHTGFVSHHDLKDRMEYHIKSISQAEKPDGVQQNVVALTFVDEL